MIVPIGVPCSREIRASFVNDLNEWTSDRGAYEVPIRYDAMAGRIDISRSKAWEWAKELGADIHLQIDTDVKPLIPFKQAMSYIKEDFDNGYDVIIAPTCAAYNGAVMLKTAPDVYMTGRGPFEIEVGAFGFVAFSPRILEGLPPIASYVMNDDAKGPLYGISVASSEDYIWCINARKNGFKVGADGRLLVAHYKWAPMVAMFQDAVDQEIAKHNIVYVQKQAEDVLVKGLAKDHPVEKPRPAHTEVKSVT